MGRRYYSYLVFLGLLVAFFLPLPSNGVEAQGATCPDNTNPFGPAPTGSYALDALCLDNEAFADFSVSFDDDYPCNSAILVEDNVGATLNDRWGEMAWSPPTGMTFPNGYATIRFWLNVTTVWGNYDGAMHVRIISYYGGSQLQSISVPVRSFPSVTNGDGFRELEWWRVSQDIQMGSGGYVTVELVNPTPLYASEHLYSSIQIYQQGQFAPPLCDVPGAPPPTPTPTPTTTGTPTPTPTPGVVSTAQTGTPVVTVTPSATNDPTRTPPFTPQPTTTPYPTSAGGTSTPLPTPTQYVPRERTPEPTPSPIFVQPMPTPNYPSISFPSVPGIASPAPLGVALTPNATTESQIQSVESWESDVNLVISSWQTQTNEALSWINPNITNTTGISTPAQIANVISNAVVRPIATIRALYLYMPNLWPFILMVLLMFGWIMFNLFAKYGLTIISEILEVVRRIIELIPGF